MGLMKKSVLFFLIVQILAVACVQSAKAIDAAPLTANSVRPAPALKEGIEARMKAIAARPAGERIAIWAESFVGTPYDTDPLGAYVSCSKIVCDELVDCMYLVFRSAELGLSRTPQEAEERALDLRFRTHGRLEGGKVANYDERFEYGEDMVFSGKWGANITAGLGKTAAMPGSRGRSSVGYIPKDELLKFENYGKLQDGDIIFFLKDPSRRVVGEIVGHLGIISLGDCSIKLIHASGSKSSKGKPGGGIVKEVDLIQYLKDMKFVGALVTRFQ
jgi:hypothetical protein